MDTLLQISLELMQRLLIAFIGSLLFCSTAMASETCPQLLADARQLILAVSPDAGSRTAEVRLFERSSPDAGWKQTGIAKSASLGRSGMGWAWNYRALAAQDEPLKSEGDGRTPAGVFTLGGLFGFGSSSERDYTRLESGKNICVDDLRSPHYNTVVSRTIAGGGTSGEDMGTISLYRRGLFVGFPTDREQKGGSCIFIHVWRRPDSPTSGCVALAERDVTDLQKWSRGQPTVIAILWRAPRERLRHCLPE